MQPCLSSDRESPAALRSLLPFLFILTVAAAVPCSAKSVFSSTITNAAAIRQLSQSEAARQFPIQIRGVVTFYDPSWNSLFVQDRSAGIFVFLLNSHVQGGPLQVGQNVRIGGLTTPADFVPAIDHAEITVERPSGDIGRELKPAQPSDEELFGGKFDSQWVELTGIVRSVREEPSRLFISARHNGRPFTITLLHYPKDLAGRLVDSEVAVTGVAASHFNKKRQILGLSMNVDNADLLRIAQGSEISTMDTPPVPIESVGQFTSDGGEHRVHVRAVVQATDPGTGFFISDETGTVLALRAACDPQPGDRVDVLGFPGVLGYHRTLEDAVCRVSGRGTLKPPSWSSVDQLLAYSLDQLSDTKDDMSIVRLKATLLSYWRDTEKYTFLLQSGKTAFTAILPVTRDVKVGLRPDSLIELTGVCAIQFNAFQQAEAIRILLRSPRDLVVVQNASFWGTRTSTWFVAALGLFAAIGFLWVRKLRRKLKAQTATIRHDLESKTRLEDRYKRLFESNLAAVLSFTPDGRILDCNPAFAQLLKIRSPQEAIGRNLADSLRNASDLACFVSSVHHSGSTAYTELSFNADDGSRPLVLASGVRDEDSEQQTVIQASLIDITAQRNFEQELIRAKEAAETASRLKSHFLANISHEIRTPLNGVLGMTSLALSAELSKEVRDYLEMAKDSATHLLELLNDVLDYSKIEAGKLELESTTFDVRDLFRKAVRTLAVRAQEKGLELLYVVDENVPVNAVGDPHRIRQILLNLIGNAIKFTSQGEIVVTASGAAVEGAFELKVSVHDTGIGISFDAQLRIFDPFTQADESTTRKFGGTGLGLSICGQLVTLMGGRISVQSKPQEGSTFAFTCVLGVPAGIAEARKTMPNMRGRSAIVVIANPRTREIVAKALQSWGLDCYQETDPSAALKQFTRLRDCGTRDPFVILEVRSSSPEKSWLPIQIRELVGSNRTVIALLDGFAVTESLDGSFSGDHKLSKPLDLDDLREVLAKIVAQEPASAERPAEKPAPERRSGLHILLAEDNPVNQKVACAVLKRLGHTVKVVGNGAEAVTAVQQETYNAVLMDVQMPYMDGFEATARIRALDEQKTATIPIVALTAHAMEGYRERCIEAGMDEYLTKPINSALLSKILESLGRSSREPVVA